MRRLLNGAQWVLYTIDDLVERHTLELGPLVFTTRERLSEGEINAFELGRNFDAPVGGLEPKPARVRHLHPV